MYTRSMNIYGENAKDSYSILIYFNWSTDLSPWLIFIKRGDSNSGH